MTSTPIDLTPADQAVTAQSREWFEQFRRDDDYSGAGAIFWLAFSCLFGIGLALALFGVYLGRVTGLAGWWITAAVGAGIVALCGAAVWQLWKRTA